jgi:hypothetical protein
MRVSFHVSKLFQVRWSEYAVRFFFGGLITVCAGLIAKYFGPVVGGLFLGFPAIFPATATLVDRHEREKKEKAGIPKTIRGRQVAALDALGAAMGGVGLITFGVLVWKLLPLLRTILVLTISTAGWFGVSFLLWRFRKSKTRLQLQRVHDVRHSLTGD